MRIFVYVRSDRGRPWTSVLHQESAAQIAAHEGWTIVDTFDDVVDDAAEDAPESLWDRPRGAAMRARLGEVGAVLAPRRDLVSRRESDFQVFADHGVRLLTMDDL